MLQNGTMAIFGGYDFQNIDGDQVIGLKNDIWIFNFSAGMPDNPDSLPPGEWLPFSTAPDSPIPPARMFHTASYHIDPNTNVELMTIAGGTIFARYSGTATTVLKSCGVEDVWQFNFDTRTWTQLVPHTAECNSSIMLKFSFMLLVFILFGYLLG